jgi:hypothetical protein
MSLVLRVRPFHVRHVTISYKATYFYLGLDKNIFLPFSSNSYAETWWKISTNVHVMVSKEKVIENRQLLPPRISPSYVQNRTQNSVEFSPPYN